MGRQSVAGRRWPRYPNESVSATWRHKHVLASAVIDAQCLVLDLRDPKQLNDLERIHAMLLAEQDLSHLDLHEITTRLRDVTRTIAAAAYDDGVAVVRVSSFRYGGDCYALFEHRAERRRRACGAYRPGAGVAA
jgi:RES domain